MYMTQRSYVHIKHKQEPSEAYLVTYSSQQAHTQMKLTYKVGACPQVFKEEVPIEVANVIAIHVELLLSYDIYGPLMRFVWKIQCPTIALFYDWGCAWSGKVCT